MGHLNEIEFRREWERHSPLLSSSDFQEFLLTFYISALIKEGPFGTRRFVPVWEQAYPEPTEEEIEAQLHAFDTFKTVFKGLGE